MKVIKSKLPYYRHLNLFCCSYLDLPLELLNIEQFFILNEVSLPNETIRNRTNEVFGNAPKLICVPLNISGENSSTTDISYTCEETHISFGVFLFVLLYTPSCNIISAIFGPCTAGMLSKIWGFVLATTGAVMWMAGNLYELRVPAALFGTLGIYLIIIGKIREKTVNSNKHRENIVQKKREFFYKLLLFPFLLILSPFLLILLRMLSFLKPSNEFIRKQTWNLVISFKGPTRLCFEFFIIFMNRQPSWLTLVSICAKCIVYPINTYIIYRRNHDKFPFPTSDRQWVMNKFIKLGTSLYIRLHVCHSVIVSRLVPPWD